MTNAEMDRITTGLSTKSAKIRALYSAGITRAKIAEYLQIRYQHVRNVLVGPSPKTPRPPSAGIGSELSPEDDGLRLTIEQAKRGLAASFSVPMDCIEIIIRG